MAVLTEAIEAERGAGAVTAGDRDVTVTVIMTAMAAVETFTEEVVARELALARLLMTGTIGLRGAGLVATRRRDGIAAEIVADAARLLKDAVNRPN